MTDYLGLRREVTAAAEARKELGEEIASRREDDERKRNHQKEVVLGSMRIAVPLLLFAVIFTGLPGVIAICVALIAIAAISART